MHTVRITIKAITDAIAFLCVTPLMAIYFLAAALWPSRRDLLFQDAGQALSLVPGLPGVFLRRAFYKRTLESCSNSVWIGFGSVFTKPEARVGDHVYIGANCMIGLASIGADTLLGSNVDIPSGKSQHSFDDPYRLIRLQPGHFNRVSVGADAWIGNGAIVLADIGDHAVVAAGTVVVDPIESRTIVAGNPARPVGRREFRDAGRGTA